MSGMITMIYSGPISYRAQKQPVTAMSTTETEYIAASPAVQELIWLKRSLEELRFPLNSKALLCCVNQSALKLIKNPEFHQRTKHIEIRFHFIRQQYNKGDFDLE